MNLLVTIDTEEDNWQVLSNEPYTTTNIEELPNLQRLCDSYRIKPTYLVTYQVASNLNAANILKTLYQSKSCDIGAHCHPWNTPPLEEDKSKKNTMLCHLNTELQLKKLTLLRDTIRNNIGITPLSFRAGRWGYSYEVAENINKLGFLLDTSVCPYVDWRDDFGPDFSNVRLKPYWLNTGPIFRDSPELQLLEIPATIGFLQQDFESAYRLYRHTSQGLLKRFHITGLLSRLRVVNKIWLSPETSSTEDLIELTKKLQAKNFSFINLVFHSSSLKAGLTPFVKTKTDQAQLLEKLKEFFEFTQRENISSITLNEAYHLVQQRHQHSNGDAVSSTHGPMSAPIALT